jgi:hypothetical protein
MYLLEQGQIPRGARKVQISTKLTGAGLGSIFFSQKKINRGLLVPMLMANNYELLYAGNKGRKQKIKAGKFKLLSEQANKKFNRFTAININ